MSRVVLAMSGGVDSSVAAHLLRAAGHDVVGVFMRHGEPVATACSSEKASAAGPLAIVSPRADHKQGCCSAADAADARRVADRLDIPFYAIDFQDDFRQIIDYFIDEYAAARTPNPCVMCNNWIKFGRLFDYADSVGADYVATGHYARLLAGQRARRLAGAGPRRRRSQRPVVRPVRHRAATPPADDAAGGRLQQAGNPPAGRADRPRRGAEARQPGNLLHPLERSRRVHPPATADPRPRPARSSPATARSSARTTGWNDSPSASARDWAWPWASRASSSAWNPRRIESCSAPRKSWTARASPPTAPTGSSLHPTRRAPARSKSATTRRPCRPR